MVHDLCAGFRVQRWDTEWPLSQMCCSHFLLNYFLHQALPALCQLPIPGLAEGHPPPELRLCCLLVGLASASPLREMVCLDQCNSSSHPSGSLSGDTVPGFSAPNLAWTPAWDVKPEMNQHHQRLLHLDIESSLPDSFLGWPDRRHRKRCEDMGSGLRWMCVQTSVLPLTT